MTRFELECLLRRQQDMRERRARLTAQCIELLAELVERPRVISKLDFARALGANRKHVYEVIRNTPAIGRIMHQHARLVSKKSGAPRFHFSPPLVPKQAACRVHEPA